MSDLNKIYYKHCWLLGQFVQHSLLHKEGIVIPSPDELKDQFKTTSDMLNYRQSEFGCKFDWESELLVKFKGKIYNVFNKVREIIFLCKIGDIIDAFGFDMRGIDFPKACRMADSEIIQKIINNPG